jgi:Neurotransmitter-gated ion-channel ligand binding domain
LQRSGGILSAARCVRTPLRAFAFVVALVVAVGGGFAAARATDNKQAFDLREHPTGGKTPVEVSIGLYLTNLVAIDESRETFEVTGYLSGQWRDPRLQLPAGAGDDKTPRSLKAEEIWSPLHRRKRPQYPPSKTEVGHQAYAETHA